MTNATTTPSRTIVANGVDLYVQTFGDAAAPAILLIAGAASSMDWWEDEFCKRLASGRRFVIRFDLRDTGQSVTYEPGAPGYNQLDLVADAVRVLDALGVPRAHIVGISMGGGLAQRLALDHPARVASLTLMSTSPGGPGGPDNPDLPPMSDELASVFEKPGPQPDWSDREAAIDYLVEGQRPFAGSLPFDEAGLRGPLGEGLRPDGRHRGEHDQPLDPRGRRADASAAGRDRCADPCPPRHRRSVVPIRSRRGARGGRPRDAASGGVGAGDR